VNAVAEVYEGHGDRVIVSEVPGTTRDSVDVRFDKDGKTLVVIDTAGVRKKRHMATNDIEFYSFHRAERSIRRADVVLMLIEGMQPISEPDKKLATYIAEQHKPVILVVNKWDLVLEDAKQQAEAKKTGFNSDLLMQEFREYLDQELKHLDYAPVAFITAKDGRNIQSVLDLAQHLYKQANERITTHKLNDVVKQVLAERRPSTTSGRKARVYYATQTDVAPPTIVLFVNNPAYLQDTYQRYMINRFRELLPYGEVPIRLIIRQRERQQLGKPAGKPIPSLDDAADTVARPPRQKPQARGSRRASAARKPKSVGGTRTSKTRGRTASAKSRRR
jgi:GTP-binding protein